MNHSALLRRELVRIKPVDRMPVNALVWQEAHDYHDSISKLHAGLGHRFGIVFGLDVRVNDGGDSVTVTPGLAIDKAGRYMMLSQAHTLNVDGDRTRCIFIKHGDAEDKKRTVSVGEKNQSYRFTERPQIFVSEPTHTTDAVELARIVRAAAGAPIKLPENPLNPLAEELNLLFRVLSHPYCYAEGAIAEASLAPVSGADSLANRAGLVNMVREANGLGFHISYGGLMSLRESIPEGIMILYGSCAGKFKALKEEQIAAIKVWREAGGTVFLEATEEDEDSVAQMMELGKAVGNGKLRAVERGHALLSSHVQFPVVPGGERPNGKLLSDDDGVIVSSLNFGGAWQGKNMKTRSEVRDAIEFGLNLCAYAYARKRAS